MTDLITLPRATVRQALEALKLAIGVLSDEDETESNAVRASIKAIKTALAEPEQERGPELRELLIAAAAMAVAAERKGAYQGASWVADAVLAQQGKEKPRSATSHIGTYYGRKNPAIEQPRQFTSFVPRPPSPPPAPQGYDGTEAGLHSFSWRNNE
jgi:hypothetical protein